MASIRSREKFDLSRPTMLSWRTRDGFPSTNMKGGTSCTILVRPPIRKLPYRGERLYPDQSHQLCVVLHLYVSTQKNVVCQKHAVSNLAVVSNMRTSHEQVITTYRGYPTTHRRPCINSHTLSYNVAVAYFKPCVLTPVLQVLWFHTQSRSGEYPVISA